MKHPLLALFLLGAVLCHAQNQDLNTHVFWDAKGTYENERYGYWDLSYLGRLNDTIPNAVAVGVMGDSSFLIYNRSVRDTAAHFVFPGFAVIRCSLNQDSIPDFLCIARQKVTLLFGTERPDSFVTALIIHGHATDDLTLNENYACVVDADSDGFEDVFLSIPNFLGGPGNDIVGRLLYFHGGPRRDSNPTQQIVGGSGSRRIGWPIAIGRVRNSSQQYLVELRPLGDKFFQSGTACADSMKVLLYKLGKGFNLVPTDSSILTVDPTRSRCLYDYYDTKILDCDGDGVDDILLTGTDDRTVPRGVAGRAVFVYKGGDTIRSVPTYYFHRPLVTNSVSFGTKIVDVGDVAGRGYHSLLITDPDADLGGYFSGAIFLYNMGSALKDSCVGLAVGHEYEGYFGTSAIPLGDVTGDGRADFMVGGDADTVGSGGIGGHVGYVAVYSGDTSYGPVVRVEDPTGMPLSSELGQNYPNPFSAQTTIEFSIVETQHVRVVLFDALGRQLSCLVDQVLAPGKYQRSVSSAGLRAGIYEYRLSTGERLIAKILTIVR